MNVTIIGKPHFLHWSLNLGGNVDGSKLLGCGMSALPNRYRWERELSLSHRRLAEPLSVIAINVCMER
jgi:hypothetical protein